MSSPAANPLFEHYFSGVYGTRWPALRAALAEPPCQVVRRNLFAARRAGPAGQGRPVAGLPHCYWRPAEGYAPSRDADGLNQDYVLDPASLLVARTLGARPGDQVLDMCAAPGGKTLVLAEQMSGFPDMDPGEDPQPVDADGGTLTANEISENRRGRLLKILQDYIPRERRLFITVRGMDANQYGLRHAGVFDRILADVPCSGERHLLENPEEFAHWSPKRTKNLAVRQFSLLSSAWMALKPGGRIVYSTCSISPEENDKVVGKLRKRREAEILRPAELRQYDFLEETECGWQVLPDRCGFGPMYFSVIGKPAVS